MLTQMSAPDIRSMLETQALSLPLPHRLEIVFLPQIFWGKPLLFPPAGAVPLSITYFNPFRTGFNKEVGFMRCMCSTKQSNVTIDLNLHKKLL